MDLPTPFGKVGKIGSCQTSQSILRLRFCNFDVLLVPSWDKKQQRVAVVGLKECNQWMKNEECNQTRPRSVFFGLSSLSNRYLTWKRTLQLQNGLEKSASVNSWERDIGPKIVSRETGQVWLPRPSRKQRIKSRREMLYKKSEYNFRLYCYSLKWYSDFQYP